MVYSKEEFKKLWESDDNGGGITYEDVADCAVAWGISQNPRLRPLDVVLYNVLKEAGCKYAHDYMPD